jgi:catechol 2,3-dioxygenase-like lactoylglutathione lyase family enzyme
MNPLSILETCLYVRDLPSAKEFYLRILKLPLHSEMEGRHVFFRCADAMLLLFQPDATREGGEVPGHGSYGPGHAAFRIEESEYEGWRTWLISCHVEIESEHLWPGGGRSIYFRDPSGNSLEFTTPATWQIH